MIQAHFSSHSIEGFKDFHIEILTQLQQSTAIHQLSVNMFSGREYNGFFGDKCQCRERITLETIKEQNNARSSNYDRQPP